MAKRRRLGDLYVVGQEMTFDDGKGEPVVVWLQKPNPVEMESIFRRASAAKNKFQKAASNRDSEEWNAFESQVRAFDERTTLVDLVIHEDLAKAQVRIMSQVEAEDEWSEDDYLQGLYDLWIGQDEEQGLQLTFATDSDHPEAKRVHDELTRFDGQVRELLEAEEERLRSSWDAAPDDELYVKATEALLKRELERHFVAEYERQQLFYGVREPTDHGKRYFATLEEVDQLPSEVNVQLRLAFGALMVDLQEGKDSPATIDSSGSSGTLETEEESQASTQEAAVA